MSLRRRIAIGVALSILVLVVAMVGGSPRDAATSDDYLNGQGFEP